MKFVLIYINAEFIFLNYTNIGDALNHQNNQAFSTKDKDNDRYDGSCAEFNKGAWWYNRCHHSNLNGLYLRNQQNNKGIRWWQWKGNQTMKKASMMIRRT